MSAISAEEWELTSVFEVNATYRDGAEQWPYTTALFRVERGGVALSFEVAPAYRDLRITLERAGAVFYELTAAAVRDVRCLREGTREWVEVLLGESDTLRLGVKPSIQLEHRYGS